jgi:hypothetical protein
LQTHNNAPFAFLAKPYKTFVLNHILEQLAKFHGERADCSLKKTIFPFSGPSGGVINEAKRLLSLKNPSEINTNTVRNLHAAILN